MTNSQRNNVITMLAMLIVLSAIVAFGPFHRVNAASDEPPPLCEPVSMAGGIMIYYCEDIGMYVNSLGFMVLD